MLGNCTLFVIGGGQWSASWKNTKMWQREHAPETPAEMARDVEQLVQQVQRTAPSVRMWVRSVNYNPLGMAVLQCPQSEWRTPPLIDGYNFALRQMLRHHEAVQFLDLDPIVGPMWDTAADWNHYYGDVFSAEVAYILHATLGSV